jgi:hypothetical protein
LCSLSGIEIGTTSMSVMPFSAITQRTRRGLGAIGAS